MTDNSSGSLLPFPYSRNIACRTDVHGLHIDRGILLRVFVIEDGKTDKIPFISYGKTDKIQLICYGKADIIVYNIIIEDLSK